MPKARLLESSNSSVLAPVYQIAVRVARLLPPVAEVDGAVALVKAHPQVIPPTYAASASSELPVLHPVRPPRTLEAIRAIVVVIERPNVSP